MNKDVVYLRQMFACCEKVHTYCDGIRYAAFMENCMLQDACIKNIEEIGEKASKISTEFRTAHPDIRWKAMIGARHHLVHDYEGIDLEVLWDVIQTDLPQLALQLTEILS